MIKVFLALARTPPGCTVGSAGAQVQVQGGTQHQFPRTVLKTVSLLLHPRLWCLASHVLLGAVCFPATCQCPSGSTVGASCKYSGEEAVSLDTLVPHNFVRCLLKT